jgi:hypothetical protein
MFRARKSFGEYVGCLLRISAVLDCYQTMFNEFSNPMPSDCNMFAPIMELVIFGHRDRSVIVPFDECREFLRVTKFLEEVSEPTGLASGFG